MSESDPEVSSSLSAWLEAGLALALLRNVEEIRFIMSPVPLSYVPAQEYCRSGNDQIVEPVLSLRPSTSLVTGIAGIVFSRIPPNTNLGLPDVPKVVGFLIGP